MHLGPGCLYWFFTTSICSDTSIFNFSSPSSLPLVILNIGPSLNTLCFFLPFWLYTYWRHLCLKYLLLFYILGNSLPVFKNSAKWHLHLNNFLMFTGGISQSLSMFPLHSVLSSNIILITMYSNYLCSSLYWSLDHERFETSTGVYSLLACPKYL